MSALIIIIIVLLIVIGGGAYIFENQNRNQPVPSNSANSPSTTNVEVSSPSASTVPGTVNNSGLSVPGMSEYTDRTFGFSFWYPGSWAVTDPSTKDSYLSLAGGKVVKSIFIGSRNDNGDGILIQEFTSSAKSITDNSDCGPADDCPTSLTYRFDPSIHSWLSQTTNHGGAITAKVLTTFDNSMGGLHLLKGMARFGDDIIVPLSASNFLVISPGYAGATNQAPLAATVLATDPAVATPLGLDKQMETIRTEGLLYGVLGKRTGDWYVDDSNVYDSNGAPVPGANPATFHLITTFSDGYAGQDTGYATDGVHIYSDWYQSNHIVAGADPASFVPIRQQFQIPYAPSSGKYGQSFTSYDTNFAKDRSHVWYEGKLIPGADPNTFIVTGDTYIKNAYGGYTLAHDAHHTYGIDLKNNLTIDGKVAQ